MSKKFVFASHREDRRNRMSTPEELFGKSIDANRQLKETVLFDLDGTLSNNQHRLPIIINSDGSKKPNPDWDNYTQQCIFDTPKLPIINICKQYIANNHYVIILTGRCESMRSVTEAWLHGAGLTGYTKLMMRPDGNYTPSAEIKRDWMLDILPPFDEADGSLSYVAYDDLNHNLEMFQKLGLSNTYKVHADDTVEKY
jgi:hypothetical protein